MKKDYFNTHLYDKLYRIQEFDVSASLDMIKEYCENYPEDYFALLLYCNTLIKVNQVESAEKLINKIDEECCHKRGLETKDDLFKKKLALTKIRICCYQEKYKEVIELVERYNFVLHDEKLGLVLAYCYQQLDKNHYKREDTNNYLINQIAEYRVEDFKEHLKHHVIDVDYSVSEEEKTAFFFSDFPTDKIIDEINKNIPNNKNKLCLGFYDNTYYFKYDNCGKYSDDISNWKRHQGSYGTTKITDYFKLVTFKDTANIITMYPCSDNKGLPYVDLNYLKEKESAKVKRKSAVDKFKERYKNWT